MTRLTLPLSPMEKAMIDCPFLPGRGDERKDPQAVRPVVGQGNDLDDGGFIRHALGELRLQDCRRRRPGKIVPRGDPLRPALQADFPEFLPQGRGGAHLDIDVLGAQTGRLGPGGPPAPPRFRRTNLPLHDGGL